MLFARTLGGEHSSTSTVIVSVPYCETCAAQHTHVSTYRSLSYFFLSHLDFTINPLALAFNTRQPRLTQPVTVPRVSRQSKRKPLIQAIISKKKKKIHFQIVSFFFFSFSTTILGFDHRNNTPCISLIILDQSGQVTVYVLQFACFCMCSTTALKRLNDRATTSLPYRYEILSLASFICSNRIKCHFSRSYPARKYRKIGEKKDRNNEQYCDITNLYTYIVLHVYNIRVITCKRNDDQTETFFKRIEFVWIHSFIVNLYI